MITLLRGGAPALVALVCLSASTQPCAGSTFAYKGNGATGRQRLVETEVLLGRKLEGVVDFADFSSPDHYSTSVAYTINAWKGAGRRLALSLPLAFKSGGSLADVAAGKLDAKYIRTAELLVQNGFSDAYLRLGWEMNGGWYPWAAGSQRAAYIAAFQHVAQVMRGFRGSRFRIVWNPAIGRLQGDADSMYPGNAVVDVIGLDAYCSTWSRGGAVSNGEAVEPMTTNAVFADIWGVDHALSFARAHAKPYAFPEWGTGVRPDKHGCGDDPHFIAAMAPLVRSAEFDGIWDYNASDYRAQLAGGQYPRAMIAYMAALGSPSAGLKSSVPAERNAGLILAEAQRARALPGSFSAQAEGGFSQLVRDGRGRGVLLVWSERPGPVHVSWSTPMALATVYDSMVGSSATRTLRDSRGTTLNVGPGPLLVCFSS